MAETTAAWADQIYDRPELGFEERFASALLTSALEERGFAVERGVGGVETAFRATYHNGIGGPVLGLICEYDALKDLGHACGHHLQGPAAIAAAAALKETVTDVPYTLVVYGTPAEETYGGKLRMLDAGCFAELDLVMMFHSAFEGGVCEQYLGSISRSFRYSVPSEPSKLPTSAFDAMQLAFCGVEQLRAYLPAHGRLHDTILDAGDGVSSVSGMLTLRSNDRFLNESLFARTEQILRGAACMAGTVFEQIGEVRRYANLVCEPSFTMLARENAHLVGQPLVNDHMLRTGSSDFSNVSWKIPACCLYACAVPENTLSHTVEYCARGKDPLAHAGVLYAAKSLAGTYFDLLRDQARIAQIQAEFRQQTER